MSLEVITQFITINSADGASQGRYQNGSPGASIVYGKDENDADISFPYLSFIYSGATRNRTGDNITSALALSSNAISMNIAYEAVAGRWGVMVETVLMNADPTAFTPNKLLSVEVWVVTNMTYDTTSVEIELSSAIDAVGLQIPNRVLLSKDVGALPLTSSIQNT